MQDVVLQKIVFPKTGICEFENLYYRKIGLPSSRDIFRKEIIFKRHQRVAFDTYINSLSLLKWTRYTYADNNFSLRITVKGSFLISLVHMHVKHGRILEYKPLLQQTVRCGEKTTYTFPYVTDNPWGCLSFCIEGLEDDSVFYNAAYISRIEEKPREVKIAIGICTFKREKYVLNNLRNLCDHILNNVESELHDKLEVFISDNAKTLSVSEFNSDKIHLFPNKNTGGSGGFTRCMIEVNNANEKGSGFTHILLMDDDIIFDPEAILRTYKILSICKEQYLDSFVGGAMFRIDRPNIQHANGEHWHGSRCESFVETYNNNRDMLDIINIIENEFFTDSNYQAWWFCAIPMTICTKDNLSMPFFIKSDDIEYSIRNLRNLILLNGINVWHESFESKYSAPNEYYTVRNYLISASIHQTNITKYDIIRLLKNYTKHYVCNYKYYEVEHLCNAINDFLKGVDYFKSIDIDEMHKKLMQKGYKMVDKDQLPVQFSDDKYFADISYEPHWTKLRKKIAKHLVNGLVLPAKGFAVLGMWGGTYAQTYRKKFIVRYEISTKKGFIIERSFSKFIKVYSLFLKTKKNILRKFDSGKTEFHERRNELHGIDIWSKIL